MNDLTEKINWEKVGGLAPAIIQDAGTRQVLMLGYMNKEALQKTITDKKVWFFSRTKNRLWMKGEESKNVLIPEDISLDCDQDTLLIKVRPVGPTCHTGETSCFGKKEQDMLDALFAVIKGRKSDMPENSYTTSLFRDGLDQICAKVEEESEEVIRAAKGETRQRVIEESADVLYHLFVLLAEKDVDLIEVKEELTKRSKGN